MISHHDLSECCADDLTPELVRQILKGHFGSISQVATNGGFYIADVSRWLMRHTGIIPDKKTRNDPWIQIQAYDEAARIVREEWGLRHLDRIPDKLLQAVGYETRPWWEIYFLEAAQTTPASAPDPTTPGTASC